MRYKMNKKTAMLPGYAMLNLWILFTFFLIGWIVVASLSTTSGIFGGKILSSGFHPSNYSKALFTHNVATYFKNSMLYTFTACTGVILIAAPAAYILARYKFKFSNVMESVFVSALGIPQIMIILPLFALVTKLNIANSRLLLIILYIGINVPFTLFFLITFFKTIPKDFEEAAAIDGCSPMKTFWIVIFPLAQPAIVTVTIFNFITVWNEYFMALIFANTSELRPVAVGLYSMIQSMRYIGDWAGMFAAVVIVFLPTFLLYIFLSEKIIAGVTGGGVKG
ncbi:MAG: carbohydrate ABC transporter permease [Clostridia bacterium]|nr:carbohydrate ABC transporter permease [Clostridia bacterium]